MITEEIKKKPAPKYKLPSQRILDIVNELKTSQTPMGAIDMNIMISLAILDKLEEAVLVLRSFRPTVVATPGKLEEKKP